MGLISVKTSDKRRLSPFFIDLVKCMLTSKRGLQVVWYMTRDKRFLLRQDV